MPVNDEAVHLKVLADLRGVVHFFYEASRGDSTSPAYLQLRHTIDRIQAVVEELQESACESKF
jgi:hypothetical protein